MRQSHLVRSSPFGHFLDAQPTRINTCIVEFLLKRYDSDSRGFHLGTRQVFLPFNPAEFSVVLGLHRGGQHVPISTKRKSRILDKYFCGKSTNIERQKIVEYMQQLVGDRDEHDDFARPFILLVFSCLLFPNGNQTVPPHVCHYVDNLETIGLYSWGDATFTYLLKSMELSKKGEFKKQVNGCLFGLLGWLFERIPDLVPSLSDVAVPRYRRWDLRGKSIKNCIEKLRIISAHEVKGFFNLPGERRFMDQTSEM